MSTFRENLGRFILPDDTVVMPGQITAAIYKRNDFEPDNGDWIIDYDWDKHFFDSCTRYDRAVGKKDKNGVEMYENDRVISADREYTIIFSTYTGWMLDTGISWSSLGDREDIEVIGHVPFGNENGNG